jgi:hypothetical protein
MTTKRSSFLELSLAEYPAAPEIRTVPGDLCLELNHRASRSGFVTIQRRSDGVTIPYDARVIRLDKHGVPYLLTEAEISMLGDTPIEDLAFYVMSVDAMYVPSLAVAMCIGEYLRSRGIEGVSLAPFSIAA